MLGDGAAPVRVWLGGNRGGGGCALRWALEIEVGIGVGVDGVGRLNGEMREWFWEELREGEGKGELREKYRLDGNFMCLKCKG